MTVDETPAIEYAESLGFRERHGSDYTFIIANFNAGRKHGMKERDTRLQEARDLMTQFCQRVENGSIRSKNTYQAFKDFLSKQP